MGGKQIAPGGAYLRNPGLSEATKPKPPAGFVKNIDNDRRFGGWDYESCYVRRK